MPTVQTRNAGFDRSDCWKSLLAFAVCVQITSASAQPRIELPRDAAVGSGILQPCFDQLPGTVRCGRFRVPEDRAADSGRTLDLAFVVADALEPTNSSADAVTFLLGGPGAAPVSQAGNLISFFSGLRSTRDLLLVDSRGVGQSGALSCDGPYPGGVASRFESLFPLDHIANCARQLSRHAKLAEYTSTAATDDLDELREWLNYSALNFYTGSYGTKEAQVFLRRHPSSVRSLVLNAASPIFKKSYLSHARFLDHALRRLVNECLSSEQCNSDYPTLREDLRMVLARVDANPPLIEADGASVAFGSPALGYALRGLLYQRGEELPAMIDRAARGEWQPLADYYLERQGWVSRSGGSAGYHLSAICAESIAFITEEDVREQTAGTFLGSHLIDAYRRACEVWPHANLDPSFLEPVESDVPTLILSGERDPVTPPENGAALLGPFSNALHVVIPGGGHGALGDCYQAMVRALIETASLENIDQSCVGRSEPTAFRSPSPTTTSG